MDESACMRTSVVIPNGTADHGVRKGVAETGQARRLKGIATQRVKAACIFLCV